jgi:hypothetical protein
MSGKSSQTSQTNQTSQTTPYSYAQPGLDSIIGGTNALAKNAGLTGTERGAFDTLSQNAQGGNPYAPNIGVLADNLLTGYGGDVAANRDTYSGYMTPTARGDYLDPSKNPFFQNTIGAISDNVSDRVNSMFAAAGRDFSGAHANTVAEGISSATAPVFADVYNQERGRQLGAADSLYNAGNSTTGLLATLGQAGIGASDAALGAKDSGALRLLEIEAQKRGIPIQEYAQLTGILGPLAQAFGPTNQSGQSTSSQTMSPAQQAWGWMNSFANLNRSWGSPQPKA